MKRVGVIGGGIFGATAAICAARAGHEVDLFEQGSELLQAASGINQYRLHRGYHYPRSPETVRSCQSGERSFREEYADALVTGTRHLYGVAKTGSKVSYPDFLAFCDANGLGYRPVTEPSFIDPARADAIEVTEAAFDPAALRALAKQKLAASGVRVHLETCGEAATERGFDKIIVAAYASTNAVLTRLGLPGETYQFELCEKPVVRLPPSFGATDIVIMDGPFLSVGQIGRSGTYALGHVVHAIHATNVGYEPVIPAELAADLNKGVVRNPAHTRFGKFVEFGAPFIPALAHAEHLGSMFTVRAVLPDRDDTDERPTLVEPVGERIIKIFSGKIGNCVEAGRAAAALI